MRRRAQARRSGTCDHAGPAQTALGKQIERALAIAGSAG
jgi:hypothetical protein